MRGALAIFAWSRLAIWGLAAATVLLFEDHLNPSRRRWDTPRLHELGDWFDVLARWDSDWYLRIAESGYRVLLNTGPDAGQQVFHLHLHLIGGRPLKGSMG